MEEFVIFGGNKLSGQIEVECSKNSLLPIIAASIMASGEVKLKDVPLLSDVANMLKIAEQLGAKVEINNSVVTIDSSPVSQVDLPKGLAGSLRASVLFIGALLARFGRASTYMPGGCNIGSRPIDMHIAGFKTLGVSCQYTCDQLICQTDQIIGGQIKLKMPSVGATENLIMAASLASGKVTKIVGAATEPEIQDLCNFINFMGGSITGAGTSVITITGVDSLHGITYRAISDRIVAGTYLIASAMCGGEVVLKNALPSHNKILISILLNLGCQIKANGDNIYILSPQKLAFNSQTIANGGLNLQTAGYPGFATDLQAQTMAMLAMVEGTHTITETLFENRFNHISQLVNLGAAICSRDRVATIVGVPGCYHGGVASSCDLRAGAALVLAGLAAKSGQKTVVQNIHYIDRGYFKLEQKLSALGANISRRPSTLV